MKKGRTMEAQGTGVTRVWLEKVQELTQEHEALEASCLSRHQAVEKWFAGRMKDLAERREGLFANPEDLVVLVRTTQGGDLEVYHSAAGTCRRAPRVDVARMLEHEARRRRLVRCSACSWPRVLTVVGAKVAS
ncbi:MAG: hypothetical protein V9F04_09650 [Dermatophilaceae bacterium]